MREFKLPIEIIRFKYSKRIPRGWHLLDLMERIIFNYISEGLFVTPPPRKSNLSASNSNPDHLATL